MWSDDLQTAPRSDDCNPAIARLRRMIGCGLPPSTDGYNGTHAPFAINYNGMRSDDYICSSSSLVASDRCEV